MKAETLVQMMEQKNYQTLTCAKFAAVVRKSGVLEVEVAADDLEFLKEEWMPREVIYHTNKDKK